MMAETEEELKNLLMKVKEDSEKVDLEQNIQKTKIMASGPITSWQIDGETMETVTDFFLGASKSLQMVTAAMKLKDTCFLDEKLCKESAYQAGDTGDEGSILGSGRSSAGGNGNPLQ